MDFWVRSHNVWIVVRVVRQTISSPCMMEVTKADFRLGDRQGGGPRQSAEDLARAYPDHFVGVWLVFELD